MSRLDFRPGLFLGVAWLALLVLLGCAANGASIAPLTPAITVPNPAGFASSAPQAEPSASDTRVTDSTPTPSQATATSTNTSIPPTVTPTRVPPTATPSPTSTPLPPHPVQLTTGGCCVQPTWLPDSQGIIFIDKPLPESPTGLYSVALSRPLEPPVLFQRVVANYSPDYTLRAVVQDRVQTYVERVADGKRWVIPNGGRSVSFAPDSRRIAWTITEEFGAVSDRRTEIWIAEFDGTGAKRMQSGLYGGFSGWLPDGSGYLYTSRETRTATERILSFYSLLNQTSVQVARGDRFSNITPSPRGTWVLYGVNLATPRDKNGLYLANLEDGSRRKLDLYVGMQWRDDNRLVYISPRASPSESFQLWELDARTGQTRRLLDPVSVPLFIANADWRVSPDGQGMVFLSAVDRNIYWVRLP